MINQNLGHSSVKEDPTRISGQQEIGGVRDDLRWRIMLWVVLVASFFILAGCVGAKGDVGATGPIGDTGPQGERGERGPNGKQGVPGATGPIGDTGPQGERGERGPNGKQGVPGATGSKGATGTTGTTGPRGVPGPTGDTGPQGIQGGRGLKGPQGDRGPQGPSTNLVKTHYNQAFSMIPTEDWKPISDMRVIIEVDSAGWILVQADGHIKALADLSTQPVWIGIASDVKADPEHVVKFQGSLRAAALESFSIIATYEIPPLTGKEQREYFLEARVTNASHVQQIEPDTMIAIFFPK